MPNGIPITIIGNLTADPDIRYTTSGAAVATFTIAHTARVYDRQASEWKDGDTTFLRCTLWRQAAENAAETLRKGMRVIAFGQLHQRDWQDREGNKRSAFEVEIDEIGPSIKNATAEVRRAGDTKPRTRTQAPAASPQKAPEAARNDPWAQAELTDEPPPF